MSDNPMKLTVNFNNKEKAKETGEIIQAAQCWIFNNTDKECFLSDYLIEKGLSNGIDFDSYWVPSGNVKIEGKTLQFELVGSPGDDLPGDIVLWLGEYGAKNVNGTLEFSGTGDIIEINHSF